MTAQCLRCGGTEPHTCLRPAVDQAYREKVNQFVHWTLSREEKFDFRTSPSLAKELGFSVEDVEAALSTLKVAGMVRQPIVADSRYDDWWRWSPKGLTRQEKWERWRSYLTFTPLREDVS